MEMMDSLKKICFENNNIRDRGVIALARALEENDTLLSLYLENNNIT
jgi:Ran GTPase-activating protein (RanGAP) involved in mRNA processing and transport